MQLNNTQIDECLAPSKKYDADAYKAVLDGLKLKGKATVVGVGRCEANFPGVKPQHVAHMLKQLKGDDDTVTVTIHAEHGVVAIRRAKVAPVKAAPAKAKKVAPVASDEPKTI